MAYTVIIKRAPKSKSLLFPLFILMLLKSQYLHLLIIPGPLVVKNSQGAKIFSGYEWLCIGLFMKYMIKL